MMAFEQKWVVPLFLLGLMVLVGLTNRPAPPTWYDAIEDYQINTLAVEELAGWIIQGRNHFIPVLLLPAEAPTLDNIPGLVHVNTEEPLEPQIADLPTYKKWIILTIDGTLPSSVAAILTEDWKRRIILLKGGASAWNAKISAEKLEELPLSANEHTTLQQVRPFFHPTGDESVTIEAAPRQRYIAPASTPPPLLENNEVEVEEGC